MGDYCVSKLIFGGLTEIVFVQDISLVILLETEDRVLSFFPIQFTKPAYIGILRCAGSNFCRPPVPRRDTVNETLIFYVFEKSNLFLSDKSRERPSSIHLLKLF